MSREAERIAVGTLFANGWGSTTPVSIPNKDFTPPQDTEWVRLSLQQADAFRLEMGAGANRQSRTVGIVFVQVFVPVDTGDGRASELADLAAAIFRDQVVELLDPRDGVTVIGRMIFRSPTISEGGDSQIETKGVFFQMQVGIPYIGDSIQ